MNKREITGVDKLTNITLLRIKSTDEFSLHKTAKANRKLRKLLVIMVRLVRAASLRRHCASCLCGALVWSGEERGAQEALERDLPCISLVRCVCVAGGVKILTRLHICVLTVPGLGPREHYQVPPVSVPERSGGSHGYPDMPEHVTAEHTGVVPRTPDVYTDTCCGPGKTHIAAVQKTQRGQRELPLANRSRAIATSI